MVVRLVGDGASYQRMLADAGAATARTGAQVQAQGRQIEDYGRSLKSWATGLVGTVTALAGVSLGAAGLLSTVGAAGEREKLQLSFETLVGGAAEAKASLADLVKFAADTPFELPEVLGAAKQMIAFGQAASSIVPTMRMLGDVSAGLSIPLGELTYLYGTLKSQGRAFTQDINQFAGRGVPIWKELEKQLGKSNAQVRQMVEQGKVGFDQIEKAFKAMTGQGGQFHGMTEKLAQSFPGLVSTLKDTLGQAAVDLGTAIVEGFDLKSVVKNLTAFVAEVTAAFGPLKGVFGLVRSAAVEAWTAGASAATTFVEENKGLIQTVMTVAGVIAGAVAAWKVLSLAVMVAGGIMSLFHVQTLLGVAGWLLWQGIVLTATAVVGGFNLMMAGLNILFSTGTAAEALWAVGAGVATAATWVWNAALTAMDILLYGVIGALVLMGALLAAPSLAATAIVAAVALMSTDFSELYGYVKPVVDIFWQWLGAMGEVLKVTNTILTPVLSIFDVLSSLPTTFGPIKEITDLFNGWWTSLGKVLSLAQTDLPLAWSYLKASAMLAISQVKDVFPPLWEFVSRGFAALWELVSQTMSLELQRSTLNAAKELHKLFDVFGMLTPEIEAEFAAMNKAVDAAQAGNVRVAKARLQKAAKDFKVIMSDDTLAALADVQAIEELVDAALAAAAAGSDKVGKKEKDREGTEAAIAKSMMAQVQATGLLSAEALTRLQRYSDLVRAPMKAVAAAAVAGKLPGQPQPKAVPKVDVDAAKKQIFDALKEGMPIDALAKKLDRQLELLKILAELAKAAAGIRPVRLEPAALPAAP